MQANRKLLLGLGVVLILIAVGLHLINVPDNLAYNLAYNLDGTIYKSALILANALISLIAAISIFTGIKSWVGDTGSITSTASFMGYLISRTFGLPMFEPEVWLEPLVMLFLIVEGAFTLLNLYSRNLVQGIKNNERVTLQSGLKCS